MKAIRKIIFISCIALAVGAILFIIGFAAIGWDFRKLDTVEYTAKTFSVADGTAIDSVEIDVGSFPVVVKSGDAVTLDYYEASNSDVSVGVEGGAFKVRERMRFEPFRNGLFNIGRFDRYFVLTVGSGVTVKISGSTTDVEFRSASYESVTVRSTNADIGFIDCTLGELSIDSTNLDATFDNCEFGDISVDSVNTDITVRNSRGDSLSVKSTNLTSVVEATLCRAVEHRGDNSDIMFDRVATDRLKVNAVNLDAYILIDGARSDYLLSAPSEVGPDDKIIDIHAVNKDVELKFTR